MSAIFLLLWGLFCISSAMATGVTGTISSNQLWTTGGNPYVLSGTVTVGAGVTLTIQPGVVVQFDGTASELVVQGRLLAQGTSASRITFTSNAETKSKGNWLSLYFYGSDTAISTGSILDYVTVEYGGYPNNNSNIRVKYASVTISNSIIQKSMAQGIYVDTGGSVAVSATSFIDNGVADYDYPIYLGEPSVDSSFSNLSMTGHYGGRNNAIGVGGGTIRNAVRWEVPGSGVPYYILAGLVVGNGGTLSIDPGVTVKFTGSELAVEDGGILLAIGTSLQPITFTALDIPVPPAYAWSHIRFSGTLDRMLTGSIIEYANIYYANNGIYAEWASPTLRHVTIANCAGAGFYAWHNSGASLSDCHSNNNGSWAYHFRFANGNPTLVGLTASGNGGSQTDFDYNAVAFDMGAISTDATWTYSGLPYVLLGDVEIQYGATLTIDPGTEIRFGQGCGLQVHGRLLAAGRPASTGVTALPILFTSAERYTRTRGYWGAINFEGFEAEPSLGSVLDNVVVEYGGKGNENAGSITAFWGQANISRSTIRESGSNGIVTSMGGDMVSVRSSQIVLNSRYGILNRYPTGYLVSAPNNWWGSASGPTTSCNSQGTGSWVSEGVEFQPFSNSSGTPGVLTPGSVLTLTLQPDRWYVPADGVVTSAITATLLDGSGRPVAGRQILADAANATVTSGAYTDLLGKAMIAVRSTTAGETTVRAGVAPTTDPCEQVREASTIITFTPYSASGDPGLNSSSPYTSADIDWSPKPLLRNVAAKVRVTVRNPSNQPVQINGLLFVAQSGIGLTTGPYIAQWEKQSIAANSSVTLVADYTPGFEGHFCFRFEYSWTAGIAGGRSSATAAPAGQAAQQANTNTNPSPMTPINNKPRVDENLNKEKKKVNVRQYGTQTSSDNKKEQSKKSWRDYRDMLDVTHSQENSMKKDPPRADYTVIAVPVKPAVTVFKAGDDEFTAEQAAAFNTLMDAMADRLAITRALLLSDDRYAGAAQAEDTIWMAQQNAAYLHYQKELGKALQRYAAALDTWLAVYPYQVLPTVADVVEVQNALKSTGFSADQEARYRAIGATDADIAWIKQEMINADPASKAIGTRAEFTDSVVNCRDLGNLLANPEPSFSQQISGGGIRSQAASSANLALAGAVESAIRVGNTEADGSNVVLRVRRTGLPDNWSVTLTPQTLSNMKHGEEREVKVLIAPSGPVPQGTVARASVEGFVGTKLIGGVEFKVPVPSYAPFSLRVMLPVVLR